MSIIAIRYRNRHRSAPVREAVVVQLENADYCALTQLSIMTVHVDTGHLSQYIISQFDWVAPSSGRAII